MIRFLFVLAGVALIGWGVAWMFVGDGKDAADRQQREAYAARAEELKPEAARGVVEAQYDLAILYHRGLGVERDLKEAVRLYTAAGKQGHPDALLALGRMYETGDGVRRSYRAAADRYVLAARIGGKAEAQFALGELYFHGRGVAHDYTDAFGWYRKAALQGHAAAQFLIGVMHAEGWGRERDSVTAYMWYTLALAEADAVKAVNRDFDPASARAFIAEKMTQAQIGRAEKLVREWRPARR